MIRAREFLLVLAGAALATPVSAQPPGLPASLPGVPDPARARQHWILQCQGCHRPDATATTGSTPALAGTVARFLAVPGGRVYLVRVPGVATAGLTDRNLAELLNWTLYRYDRAHIPAGFRPYTVAEVARWRRQPFRTEAGAVRRRLVAAMGNNAIAK